MYIEEIQDRYKEYFKDIIDDRSYELLWTYLFYGQHNSNYPPLTNIYPLEKKPLPPFNQIKTDYFSLFKNQDPDRLIQISHLLVLNRLIPEEHLQWISKKNNVQICWLINKLKKHNIPFDNSIKIDNKTIYNKLLNKNQKFITLPQDEKISFNTPYGIEKQSDSLYKNFIYLLDTLNTTLEIKNEYIICLKNEWIKNREKIELKKWIDKDNLNKLNWINEYLQKKPPLIVYNNEIKFATANIDLYESILIQLSEPAFLSSDSRELYIGKMKKSWAQKKFRDAEKTKKPHHLPLTKRSIKQLKQLSLLMNMKEQRVIEILIEEKYYQEATRHGIPLYEE